MKPKTFNLLHIITSTIIITSLAVEGYCVFGPGSRNLKITSYIINVSAMTVLFLITIFKNKWVKQNSDFKDR